MKFGQPFYFWLLWILPIVLVFIIWSMKRKRQLIDLFVSAELRDRLLQGFSAKRQYIKAILICLVLGFSILALVRPKYGFHWEEVKRRGVDILIALDVSKSMLAEDVSPNRLERAKREIVDLIKIVEGDRLGLLAFSGTSFLQCPLTLDYGAVQIFLDELDTELIPVPGTAIAEAIEKSISAFAKGDRNSRVLILITDGEDHSRDPVATAEKAAKENVKIYTVGIGQDGGAPIPDRERGGFKKDRRGEVVLTKLDEKSLQKIALSTGGSYVRSISGNLDLEEIYKDIRASVEDKELKSGRRQRFEERFQWPLLIALILLVFEMLFPESTRRTGNATKRSIKSRFSWFGALLLTGMIAQILTGKAEALTIPGITSKSGIASDHYAGGDYSKALEKFLKAQVEDPSNTELRYNLGNTYYKLGDYANAEKMFLQAAGSQDQKISQKSFYNLGNVAFKQGKLQEALEYYKKALELEPDDEDARHNLEFVRDEIKRRLEEMKKQNQNNQQDQDSQQGQNNKSQDQQSGEQNQSKDEKQSDNSQEQRQDQSGEQDQGSQKEQEGGKEHEGQQKPQGEAAQDPEVQKEQGGEVAEQQDEQDDPQERPGASENQTGGSRSEKEVEISPEEAQRWLDSIESDRKDYLKKKMGSGQKYQVEKDW